MASDFMLMRKDLVENPSPRVPICLVLDASGSMTEVVGGNYTRTGEKMHKDGQEWDLVRGDTVTRLDLMNEGIALFLSELNQDDIARYSAEVAVVAFAGKPEVVSGFQPVTRVESMKVAEMSFDGTSMGTAVEQSLTLLDARKKEYQNAGVDYFQPWLILMTDGRPTDQSHVRVAAEVSRRVLERKLSVFPIGVGDDAGMDVLAMFSPRRKPLKLKGLCFKEFFEWLSRSISHVSQSIPGETVPLDVSGINDWAEV